MSASFFSVVCRRLGMCLSARFSHLTSAGRRPGGGAGLPLLRLAARTVGRPLAVMALAGTAGATPTDGKIEAGQGSISQVGGAVTVEQSSAKLILNWDSFGVGRGESITFQQPSADSVALNRVLGGRPSEILGSLNANGRVFLLNPAGVLFGADAQVNVGALVAGTMSLQSDDFLAGRYQFERNGTLAGVVNQGLLTAAERGFIALLAPEVRNEGVITANLGTVALAAGEKVTLDLSGGDLVKVSLDPAVVRTLIENRKLIVADGGRAIMAASAADSLRGSVVKNAGVVQARGLVERSGGIFLDAGAGDAVVSGKLDASSAQGQGGSIAVTGGRVGVFQQSLVDASGATGGGSVELGGGFRGANPDLRNADQTVVGPDAVIRADATGQGDGGRVVLWSEDGTRFSGTLSARGGSQAGNGGSIEVSSHGSLGLLGKIDLTAPQGMAGSLLLDPRNITIASGGLTALVDADEFSDTPAVDVTVDPTTITAVSNTGAAVTLQANNDITVNSSILTNKGDGDGGALTFSAGRSITLNASVTTDNGNVHFTANDSAATADRLPGTASFINNSLIDAGGGEVSITMGTNAGGSGSISAGQLTGDNITIAHNGPTAGGSIDLAETDVAETFTLTSSSARNVTNLNNGAVIVRGMASITSGGGDITITGPSTDFSILRTSGGNVAINDTNAMQIGTTAATGGFTLTTQGPMASYGGETMTVGGAASFTATAGGFGYADPYINLPNNNDFQGAVALNVSSIGQTGTGGWAVIREANALTLGAVTLPRSLDVTVGAVSAGDLVGHSAIVVPLQTTITAGSNNVTLDSAANNFNGVHLVSAGNATLADANDFMFGSVSGGSANNSISGNLSLSAGGTISQQDYNWQSAWGSSLTVGGTSTFTVSAASSDLFVGPAAGYSGQANSFTGAITLATSGAGSYRDIQVRNTSAAAATISGLGGTLRNVALNYNNAAALSLPAMTLTGTLFANAPQGSIGQTGALAVSGRTTVIANSGKDVLLDNTANDFGSINVASGRDATLVDQNGINLDSYFDAGINGWRSFTLSRNLNVSALDGDITDTSNNNGYGLSLSGGKATLSATKSGSPTNNIRLDDSYNRFGTVGITTGNDVYLTQRNGSLVLDNSTVAGTLGVVATTTGYSLSQVSGSTITSGGTTTFTNFDAVALGSSTEAYNVFGPLAINRGNITLRENDAITQASAWGLSGWTTNLTTGDAQAITLTQAGNSFGNLNLTQLGSDVGAGAVRVVANHHLNQSAAWNVHGTTTLNITGGYALALQNANNIFGPLQVSVGGNTNIRAKDWTDSGSTVHNAITDAGGTGAWSTGWTDLRAYNSAASATTGTINLANASNALGGLTLYGGTVSVTENDHITGWDGWNTTGTTTLNPGTNSKYIQLLHTSSVIGPIAISGSPTSVTVTENNDITQASAWSIGSAPVVLDSRTGAIALTQAGNVLGAITITTTPLSNLVPSAVAITEDDAITQTQAWSLKPNSGTTSPVTLVTTNAQAISLGSFDNVLGNLIVTQNGAGAGAVAIREADTSGISQAGAWRTLGTTTLDTYAAINLPNASNVLGAITVNGTYTPTAVTITENHNITQASAWALGTAPVSLNAGGNQILLGQAGNVLGNITLGGAASLVQLRENDALTQGSAWTMGTTAFVLETSDDQAITLGHNNTLGDLVLTQYNTGASIFGAVLVNEIDSSGITQNGGWMTHGVTTLNAGTGNPIVLTQNTNSLASIAVSGAPSSLAITENDAITQDSVWSIGTAPVTLVTTADQGIDLSQFNNVFGALIVTQNGTGASPSPVSIKENDTVTQGGAWTVHGNTKIDSTTNSITLTNPDNIFGPLQVLGGTGASQSVTLYAKDWTDARGGHFAITDAGAGPWTTGPVRLYAYDSTGSVLGGGRIHLTQANVLGDVDLRGTGVTLTESDAITDGTTGWVASGATTLNVSNNVITLDNAANVIGDIALSGTPTGVTLRENDDITQASAWGFPTISFSLDAQAHDVLLTQAANQLGDLTITSANANVRENHSISDSGAWTVSGLTTLTAGGNAVVLDHASGDFGTLEIVSASAADVTDSNGIMLDDAAVTTTFTLTAGGAMTQVGGKAITANSLRLLGTGGYATFTNSGNDVANLAAGFTGGDLQYTDTNDFIIANIGGTSGISIGARAVTLTSDNGTITGFSNTTVSSASTALTVSTGTALTLPQMTIDGSQTYTASTLGGSGLTLTGNITSNGAGAITFNSPVTLSNDWAIRSDNSPIVFASTLVGGTNILTVNAGNSTIDFNGAVSGLGSTGDASTAVVLTAGGTGTTFHSTLTANNGLAVTGPVVFQDNVTLADGLVGSTFGGQVTLGKVGGMNLAGYDNLSFNGGIVLQSGPATISSNNSLITFAGANTIHGPFDLTINAGTGTITGLDHVGNDITQLTVIAATPTLPGTGISIAGAQSYTATSGTSIVLNGAVASTAAGAITFNSPVVLGADATVTTVDSPISFAGTIDGAHDVTLSSGTAAKTVTGKVGSISPIGDGVGASLTLLGSGATYFGDTLVARSGISAGTAGAVTFLGSVTLADGSNGSAFGGLVTTGGTTVSGYDGLAFNGGLTLSSGPVSLISNGSTISFGATVSGPRALTLNALTAGVGTVTGLNYIGTDLTGLTVTGQTLSLPNTALSISGPMSFTAAGGITLNGDVGSAGAPATGQIDFNGPVSLATGAIAITTANSAVNFNGTVNGAQALTVTPGSGVLTFVGAVGGSTPLASSTVNGSGSTVINGGSIATSGAQSYNNAVVLGGHTTLGASGLTFGGTLDGGYNLTANVPGATTFGGVVGGATPLASITTDAPGSVVFNTSSITTSGAQTYHELATLGADLVLTGGSVRFANTVNGAHALTLSASGAARLDAAAGGSTSLTSLNVSGGTVAVGPVTTTGAQAYTGMTTLSGDLTTADSNVTVTGATTLGGNLTISTGAGAGDIVFSGSGSTINGAYGLVLSAGTGNVVLGGLVGGLTPLVSLDATGNDLFIPVVNSSSTQTYNALDDLTLSQSRTSNVPLVFTADSDGDGTGTFILPTGISLVATNQALTIQAADLDLQGSSTISTGSGLLTLTPTNGRNLFLGGTDPVGQMTITADELRRISTSGGADFLTTGSGWIKVAGIGAADSQSISGVLRLFAQGSGDVSFVNSPSLFNALSSESGSGSIVLAQDVTTSNDPLVFRSVTSVGDFVTLASNGGNIDFQAALTAASPLTVSTSGGALTFAGNVGGTSTLAVGLGGGTVTGLNRLQPTLTGFTLSNNAQVTLPAISINGPQVYHGPVLLGGNLTGIGLTFNGPAQLGVNGLVLDAGVGTLAFANTLAAGAHSVSLVGDEIDFGATVTGTGAFVLQPSSAASSVAIGGSNSTAALDLTAADLAWLPTTLSSLTVGRTAGSGTVDVAGPVNFGAIPTTLNGVGGITQTGGTVAVSGTLTLRSNGMIALANTGNTFGPIAFAGAPSSVSLGSSAAVTQASAWNLDSAPVSINAGANAIALTQSGNSFGTLSLTGGAVSVAESEDTDLGASTVSTLSVVSTGDVSTSGTVAVSGAASFKTLDDTGKSITLGHGSTFGRLNAVSRNGADSAFSGGALTLAPGASTVLGTLATTGQAVLTAASGATVSADAGSTIAVGQLALLGAGGRHDLSLGTTTFTTLAGNTGDVTLRSAQGFNIGSVNGTDGLAVTGTLTLSDTGTVSQTEALSASGLELLGAGGTFNLTHAGNAITTLAANTGAVAIRDDNGFAVGTVNTEGVTTTGNLTLSSMGAVTQTSALSTTGLELLGAGGSFTLTHAANNLATLAGNTGTVRVRDDDGFAVASVNTAGLRTTGATTFATTGTVTQTQNLAVGGLELLGVGGSYVLNRDTNLIPVLALATGTADVHTSGALELGTVTTPGATLTGNLALQAGGAITQSAPLSIDGNLALVTTHGAGNVTVNNTAAASTVLGTSLVGGNLILNATGRAVTQAPSSNLQVAGSLTVNSGSVVLDGAGNLVQGVSTLPGSNSTVVQSGVITLGNYNEAGNFTVISQSANRSFGGAAITGTAVDLNVGSNRIGGTVSITTAAPVVTTGVEVQTGIKQAPGTHLSVAGVASFTAEPSSVGSSGIIDLTNSGNSFGQITVSGNTASVRNDAATATTIASVNASNSFHLVAAGDVNQSGAIVTPALSVISAGAVSLGGPGNAVTTFAAVSDGAISYTDTDGLDLLSLDAQGHAVSLVTGGAGNLTQSGALTDVSGLSLNVGGSVALDHAANTIGALGAVSAGTGISLTDSTAGITLAGTVQSTAGDIVVTTSGDLTVGPSGQVSATGGNLFLAAQGGGNFINQSGADALATDAGHRWLVYSQTPDLVGSTHIVKDGLTSSFRLYGQTFASNPPVSINQSGNGILYVDAPTVNITVTPVVGGPATHVYGDVPTGTLGYTLSTGFIDSEDSASTIGLTGTAGFDTVLAATMNVNTYTVHYTGGLSATYTLVADSAGVDYTVTPAALTYAADPVSRIYGNANPALSGNVTGFKLGQDASALGGSLGWATPADTSSAVAGYAITGSGYTSGNYTFVQAAGNATALTVTARPLTLTADGQSRVYGDANPIAGSFAIGGQGLVNGDTLGATASVSSTAGAATAVGSYGLTPSGAAFTSGSSSNYAITYADGSLAITARPITLTASDQNRMYGSANPSTGAFDLTGGTLVNGDTLNVSLDVQSNAGLGSDVGTYDLTPGNASFSSGSVSNYQVTYADGALHVTARPLTITASNQGRIYGDDNPIAGGFVVGGSGLAGSDTLAGAVTVSSAATPASHVGSYALVPGAISFTSGSDSNYTVTYADGSLAVSARPITLRADDQGRVYGNANPTFGSFALTSGTLVNGDGLDSSIAVTSPATLASNVGSYDLTPSSAVFSAGQGSDYAVTYASGSLTVSARPVTLTASNLSRVYGDANPSTGGFALTSGSLVNGDTLAPSLPVASLAGAAADVGSYDLTPSAASFSLGSAGNYDISYANGAITVTTRPITITALNQSRYYGDANPSSGGFSVGGSGLVNGDTLAATAALATPAAVNSHVGNYALTPGSINFTSGSGSNYAATYVDGALAVTPRPITITSADQSRLYGDANPGTGTFAVGGQGLATGDALAAMLTVNSTATLLSNVGSYGLTPSGAAFIQGASSDYAITYTNGTLSVAPATLSYVANFATRIYGDANSVFSGTVTGFKNSETQGSVTSGTLAFGTAATVTSNAGQHAITGSGLTAATGNYVFDQAPGNATALTISPRPATVTSSNVTRVYGDPNPTSIPVVTNGLVNGDTVSGADVGAGATQTSNVGIYAYAPSNAAFSSGLASNYAITYVGGALTITPRPLMVSVADQNRVYGEANPQFGSLVGDNLAMGDTLGIAVVSTPATTLSNVGSYALVPGAAAFITGSSSNYAISYANGSLLVTPRPLTLTASGGSKIYGSADPAFAYTAETQGSGRGLLAGQTLTGALGRVAGESVAGGPYAVTSGTVASDNPNYAVDVAGGAALTITPATLQVSADPGSKVYGSADPVLTYAAAGFQFSDNAASVLSGALGRAPGENVADGPFAITKGTLSSDSNYIVSFTGSLFTITPAPLTLAVIADSFSRLYGDVNPDLTLSFSGFANGDTAASFITAPTTSTTATQWSNVGQYGITVSGGVNPNYNIHYIDGTLSITPAPLTIAAAGQSKIYGDLDPALTYSASGFKLADTSADVLSGSLSRVAGESVLAGPYSITQGTLATTANYALQYVGSHLTVTPAPLTVTADSQTKIYGDADPVYTYSVGGLKRSDAADGVLSGGLSRQAGEDVVVSPYALTQGSLSSNGDYLISFSGAGLTITPASISVSAHDQSKIYGDADPALTFTATGLKRGDTNAGTFSGGLSRLAGEMVAGGPYAIALGTLAPNSNYQLEDFTGAELSITPATLTIAPDNQVREYGDRNQALTASYLGLKNGDTTAVVTSGPVLATGADASSSVGRYTISASSAVASGNYNLVYTEGVLSVNPANLLLTADAKTKVYGDTDPGLTYSASGFKLADTAGSTLTGVLGRVLGENVAGGPYAILQGTVAANPNYTVSYRGDFLTITPAPLTVAANSQSKVYGDADPALTYALTGLKITDTNSVLSGSLLRAPGESVAAGPYAIGQGTLSSNGNYLIDFTGSALSVTPANLLVTADDLSSLIGAALPALTASFSGLRNNDTSAVVSGLDLSSDAVVGSLPGDYRITASGGQAANYNLSYVDGTLRISGSPLQEPGVVGTLASVINPEGADTDGPVRLYGPKYSTLGGSVQIVAPPAPVADLWTGGLGGASASSGSSGETGGSLPASASADPAHGSDSNNLGLDSLSASAVQVLPSGEVTLLATAPANQTQSGPGVASGRGPESASTQTGIGGSSSVGDANGSASASVSSDPSSPASIPQSGTTADPAGTAAGSSGSEAGVVSSTRGEKQISIELVVREQAAFEYVLPPELLARLPAVEPGSAVGTLENGQALPAWLTFDARQLRFYSDEVPSGGLPLTALVVFTAADGTRHAIRVRLSETGAASFEAEVSAE